MDCSNTLTKKKTKRKKPQASRNSVCFTEKSLQRCLERRCLQRGKRYIQQGITTLGPGLHSIA